MEVTRLVNDEENGFRFEVQSYEFWIHMRPKLSEKGCWSYFMTTSLMLQYALALDVILGTRNYFQSC